MDTKIVQILKNQNNSNELFKKWNKKNQQNIKCSIFECPNNTEEAYMVRELTNSNKFIIPLCKGCYKRDIGNNSQSHSPFTDHGLILTIQKSLLLKA